MPLKILTGQKINLNITITFRRKKEAKLMIPVFVIIGRTPEVPEHVESTESTESLLAKAA